MLQEPREPKNSNNNRCTTYDMDKNNVSNTNIERVDKVSDIINK